MMYVEQNYEFLDYLNTPTLLNALLEECSAITDYHILRDTLPRRLTHLLKCRCILIYLHSDNTLQFTAGSFDDAPGWSSGLLSVAHITPIDVKSDTAEAEAYRTKHVIAIPRDSAIPTFIAAPLIYRQQTIGVIAAIRGGEEHTDKLTQVNNEVRTEKPSHWSRNDTQTIGAIAGVVALLLENTRLLEKDRQRIQELSLLNTISSQLNSSLHDRERIQKMVIQHTREITQADICTLINFPGKQDASQEISWITPSFRDSLISTLRKQREPSPFVIERPGNIHTLSLLEQIDPNIKTFFAIPLAGNRIHNRAGAAAHKSTTTETSIFGIIIGAYRRPWKLRKEQLVLLQVLASQASAVLENIQLMAEVIEARNQARTLLGKVLEDQRLKVLILEGIPSGLITIDLYGKITTFNRAAENILGYRRHETLGHPLQKLLHLDSLQKFTQPDQKKDIARGSNETHVDTLVTLNRKGQEIILEISMLPLRDGHNIPVGALITFSDVTTMHQLAEEKRRLDRLASLGQMAASVAHEVRNPLASIKTSIQMLIDEIPPENTQGITDTTIILKEVERLDAIVRDLLLFARPRQLHRVPANLAELSDHVLSRLQSQSIEAGIEVRRLYHPVPSVRLDEAQMEQVLFNVYINALQAMPDGGTLTITCRVVHANTAIHSKAEEAAQPVQPLRSFHTSFEFGAPIGIYNDQQDWLELAIEDTGTGISTDQLEHIFQPFFTTKAHGIGLGLPITRRLVEDHGGHMLVRSQLGYGTTIVVRLPLGESDITEMEESEGEGSNEPIYPDY